MPADKISFIKFISDYFRRYKYFLQTYLILESPPFFFLIIWLAGMARVIDRMELKGKYPFDNWVLVWIVIALGGIVSGLLYYWVGGTVYHWFVRLSGGEKNYRLSRYLSVYSFIPSYIACIAMEIIDTAVYGNKYFTGATNSILDLIKFGIVVVILIYSLILSYIGVRSLQKTKPVRSVIFFIILPIILLAAILGVTFLVSSKTSGYNEQALEQMEKGNFKSAEQLFKKALDLTPAYETDKKGTILGNLGLLYENSGQTDQAIESYQNALKYYKANTADYCSTLGKIDILKGNIEKAIANFEKALLINPNNGDALNNLGLIYMGEIDDSIEDYQKALKHNEKYCELYKSSTSIYNLAFNYYMIEMYSNALPLFESLTKTSLYTAKAKYFIGLISYREDDFAKAKQYIKEAITLDPALNNETIREILHKIDKEKSNTEE
jgi:tetratricopeptide (TPR) repeat protein